jgi:class 3 adenylate cyclase
MLRRLHAVDRLLLLVLVPVWLACFALSVRAILRPAGATSFRVTAWPAESSYPEVVALAPFVAVDVVGVRPGDRLVRMAGEDMRGVGGLGFYARFLSAAWSRERVPAEVERGEHAFETTLASVSWAVFAPLVAVAPLFAFFGVAILLKAPRSGLARATCQAFLAGAFFLSPFTGPGWMAWLHVAGLCVSSLLVGPLIVRVLLLFPHGVMPASAWLRLLPFPFALFGVTYVALFSGFPYSGRHSEWIVNAASVLLVVGALGLLQRLYRRADPVARRQLKWSLFGVYLACVPPLVGFFWLTLFPEHRYQAGIPVMSFGLVPVFFYVALYRYDFFDVDRLLSATAAYNLVLVLLAAGWLLLAPRVAEAASAWLALPPAVGQGAAALGLAVLIVPAAHRLRPRLEALLFRDQHAVEAGLGALCGELSGAGNARTLVGELGHALHQRLRPESIVIYGRDGDHYAALFVEGRGVAAELPANGPVLATLREHCRPLCLSGQLAGRRPGACDPFTAATLAVLNAAVVLPILDAEGGLAALVALGPKRSGDLYTERELHLLRAVADRAALELRHFDEQQFREESRAMQAAMRRYVPGAVAERIERGGALETGEREVTVLFVDLRGYTALSEGSPARDVFSTINRYTRTVSELVRDAGGTVVEFNGDGMMAVFGAPGELAEKERAAVRSGRRIAEEVEEIEHAGRRLSVGVGIATGLAFVGNIQAADRMIWSAIGNTTNLAARLQAMTRDLDASVVIDSATHAALGGEGRGFRRIEQIAIRGRSERFDVFVLDDRALRLEAA